MSPTAAIVNNFEAVVAFMESARINGVTLRLETRVIGLILSDDRHEVLGVETNRGPVYASIVVNAVWQLRLSGSATLSPRAQQRHGSGPG